MNIKIILITIALLTANLYAELKKEYYSNGDIKREIEYTDNMKNGKSKFYLRNNQLFAMAEYKMGIRHGVYVEYDPQGHIAIQDTYVNGKMIGQRLFYENGKPLNGTFKKSTPYGENIVNYVDGRKLGLQMNCDIDSCIKEFHKKNGVMKYTVLVDGKIQRSAHYKNYTLEGEYLSYNFYNTLDTKRYYKDGKKDGVETTFYKNGNIESKTTFKDGLVIKDTINYNEDQTVKIMKNPYNGKYTYDKSQIKSQHILDDIARAKTLDADPFVLNIDESSISIFGYQTGQPVRMRWYRTCLLEDGKFNAVNGNNHGVDYCHRENKDTLILNFHGDNKKLICDNCEEYGFPSVWFR